MSPARPSRWWPPVLALVAATAATQAGPPSPPIEVHLAADPREVTVGDPIEATLTIRLQEGIGLQEPHIPRILGPFRVDDIRGPVESRQPDGRHRIQYRFRTTVFRTGLQTLPALRFEGRDGRTGTGIQASTAPVSIRVVSVLKDDMVEIADIKGAARLPGGGGAGWMLAALAAAVAAYFWLRYHRRPEPTPVAAPEATTVPVLPAHEWAYRKLRELQESSLLARGKIKHFYIELAEILKEYLNRRFRIVTAERTTSEVVQALGKGRESRKAAPGCRQILIRCDLVKFARHRPPVPESRSAVDWTRRLVDDTREAPPVAAGPPGGVRPAGQD